MVVVAMAMPNRPASWKLTTMPTMIVDAGRAVASSDTASPWITLVPWPENRGVGHGPHRPEARSGVVFGHDDDGRRDRQPDHAGPEQGHGLNLQSARRHDRPRHHLVDDPPDRADGQDAPSRSDPDTAPP